MISYTSNTGNCNWSTTSYRECLYLAKCIWNRAYICISYATFFK